MKSWLMHPRGALAFRDGRQLWEGASIARSLEIPWPSTIAGAVRHQLSLSGAADLNGSTDEGRKNLRQVAVRSGWLSAIDSAGEVSGVFVPAPGDCAWFPGGKKGELRRVQLRPDASLQQSGDTDLLAGLEVVGLAEKVSSVKPVRRWPMYWNLADMRNWLMDPVADATTGDAFGMMALHHDLRVHTAIDPLTRTAEDSRLFRSDSACFETANGSHLALGVRCASKGLTAGVLTLGADRTVASLQPDPGGDMFSCPDFSTLRNASCIRVVLLTPGLFSTGYMPSGKALIGGRVTAAVVGRAQIVSGWDMAAHTPNHSMRAAPAGSVYWVEPPANTSIEAYAQKLWMRSLSDFTSADDGCQRADGFSAAKDGFGIALVGRG